MTVVEDELDFLGAGAVKHGQAGPGDLGATLRLVAFLGGYWRRKRDPAPGHWFIRYGCNAVTIAAVQTQVIATR